LGDNEERERGEVPREVTPLSRYLFSPLEGSKVMGELFEGRGSILFFTSLGMRYFLSSPYAGWGGSWVGESFASPGG